MPDIDKILQLSSLFSVTTDCLLKDTQDDPQPAAAQTPSPLPRVTLAQAEDYLTKAQGNAPQMALATALCIVSPIPMLALGTVSELGLLGLDDDLAGGLGMIALLVLVAVAVVLFMQCGAAVREYEFLEKEPIETEHGVTALVRERRAAFAPEYDRANRMGAVLCILAAVPLFAAVMVGVSFLMSMSICLLLVLVACGVYAFVRVGTVQDAMNRLLEDGDFTRGHKAVKGRLTALTAAYWLVVVAIFLWYTFGPNGNGQPQYSWFIWAIAGVVYAACVVAAKAFVRKKCKETAPDRVMVRGLLYSFIDSGRGRACPARSSTADDLWGDNLFKSAKMRQCLCKAVCGNVVGDIIRSGLGGIAGVAHGDADPGIFQHRHIAVKRDAVQRVQVRQVHRRAACGNNVLTPFFCSAASACMVDSGRALAWNGSSVPSISKNAALICAMAVLLIRA